MKLIVGLALAIVVLGAYCSCQADTASVEAEARAWAEKLGYHVVGIACSSVDSDHDGYVSCLVNRGPHESPLPLECRWLWGSGCKLSGRAVVVPTDSWSSPPNPYPSTVTQFPGDTRDGH